MVTASALIATLFFGGWDIPFTLWDNTAPWTLLKAVLTLGAFTSKVAFFLFFFMWIRWTLPRFRYDQLMSLGWKVMLPTALAYIVIVASAILGLDYAGVPRGRGFGLAMFGLNVVLVVMLFFVLDRGRLISPAQTRVDRDRMERLRQRAPERATLQPEEIR
jgi:NADH-quinone oxidoreductase subunit H